jgi:hypothetical protein
MSSFRADPSLADEDSIQRGALFGFLASTTQAGERDARSSADVVLEGEAGYSWFGQSAAVVESLDSRLLVVGAPAARNSLGNTTGQLLLYSLGDKTSLAATITGDEALAEFGHALALSDSGTLAVSSPAAGSSGLRTRGGELRLLDAAVLSELASAGSHVGLKDVKSTCTIAGATLGSSFGRLGWHLAFQDASGDGIQDLIVGAPLTNSGVSLQEQRERGALFVWDGSQLPQGEVTSPSDSAHWHTQGQRRFGRLGSATAVSPGGLAVGSPGASAEDSEMAGVVDVLQVSFSSVVMV